jgi:predicted DNA-binding transcriptional regulator AlpA
MPEHAPQSSAYVSTLEAARLTGLSMAWFERSRWAGTGPPYVKLERSVKYPLDELHAWMRARLRTSTTDDPVSDNPAVKAQPIAPSKPGRVNYGPQTKARPGGTGRCGTTCTCRLRAASYHTQVRMVR